MQGVAAEVALHDQPGVRSGFEAGEPPLQDGVEFVLAHPDGRIRPDRREFEAVGNTIGGYGVNIL